MAVARELKKSEPPAAGVDAAAFRSELAVVIVVGVVTGVAVLVVAELVAEVPTPRFPADSPLPVLAKQALHQPLSRAM